MNYIENDDMELFGSTLSDLEVGNYIYNGRVEAFSFIAMDAQEDLKFNDSLRNKSYLEIGLKNIAEMGSSTASNPLSASLASVGGRRRSSSLTGVSYHPRKVQRRRASSLGDLSEPSTQALLCKLIYTLNEVFPDYDFGNVKLHQFDVQEVPRTMKVVNNYLSEALATVDLQLLDKMWRSIDSMVNLNRCEVFSFTPDIYADEDSPAFRDVWCFHYFFFNKDLKQLVYLTCAATSKLRRIEADRLYAIQEDDETDYYSTDVTPLSSNSRNASLPANLRRHRVHGSEDTDESESEDETEAVKTSALRGAAAVVENGVEEGESEEEEDVPDWDGVI